MVTKERLNAPGSFVSLSKIPPHHDLQDLFSLSELFPVLHFAFFDFSTSPASFVTSSFILTTTYLSPLPFCAPFLPVFLTLPFPCIGPSPTHTLSSRGSILPLRKGLMPALMVLVSVRKPAGHLDGSPPRIPRAVAERGPVEGPAGGGKWSQEQRVCAILLFFSQPLGFSSASAY